MPSKKEIDRLGKKIRLESGRVSEEHLGLLQEYRISFKDSLASVFNKICDVRRKVNGSSIVTYRIKRIQSIIGKLDRYPNMQLSRMWDIAGCRCIMRNDDEVYRLKEALSKHFIVKKEKDYIETPQPEGYRSLHLYLSLPDDDKIIELQIRNQVDHNWATLVEITDLLYGVRLKELGDNKELLRLHLLLSRIDELTVSEKKEIIGLVNKFKFFSQLSKVFSRNYIEVRTKWVKVESSSAKKFYLLESTKETIPRIEAFDSFLEAENRYYNLYLENPNANMVLTHIHKPSYHQISIAYSNYVLTFHSFLEDCIQILEGLVQETMKSGSYFAFRKYYTLHNEAILTHFTNVFREIRSSSELEVKSRPSAVRKRKKDWEKDIQKRINTRVNKLQKFENSVNPPRSKFTAFLLRRIATSVSNKFIKRLEKVRDEHLNPNG